MKKNTAFTLTEVLLVVVILGVVASFGMQNYFLSIENIRAKNIQKILRELYGSQKRYHIQNNTYTANLSASALDVKPKIDAMFTTPTITAATDTFTIRIKRNSVSPDYTLSIDQDAQIQCLPVNPANICQKLGFSP